MILAIVQARMGSTRLPNKILMKLKQKPALLHVVERIRNTEKVDQIIVATTTNPEDDLVELFCNQHEILIYRGSSEDVLDRFYQSALFLELKQADTIVRITADCPLIDPRIIDQVIGKYEMEDVDYACNTMPPTYPDGLDVEVFSFSSLERAWKEADLKSEREHVTPYIKNHPEIFKMSNLENEVDLSCHRWTLDEIDDYKLISNVYDNLYSEEALITTEAVLKFLKENPNIFELNQKIVRNEGYNKSLENDGLVER